MSNQTKTRIARMRELLELRAKIERGEWWQSEYDEITKETVSILTDFIDATTEMRDALIHIEEYCNGSETNGAMADALREIGATARAALAKSRGEN